jgi:transposase
LPNRPFVETPAKEKEMEMVNVGIDLHKTQFTVCVRFNGGVSFAKYATTPDGYSAFLADMAVFQKSGFVVRVGVESTGNTRYFKYRMEDAGIVVIVINTLKLKVITESVKKTDKHDAATIAEFLEKDMLPESILCSRESEQLRRFLKARTTLVKAAVVMKNQIHALLTAEGMEDVKGSLQSKKARQRVLDALNQYGHGIVARPLFETIDRLEENIKLLEKQLHDLTSDDQVVKLLQTIPGCGPIGAWTIRAYLDDIARFSSSKKFVSYAGLAPWVQNSNEMVRHGKITKRGPKELRTALVQVVMGMRRLKEKTMCWRMMERYEAMKKSKGSGKTIIAAARKVAVIIWEMLSAGEGFDINKMLSRKPAKESEEMSLPARMAEEALEKGGEEKPLVVVVENIVKEVIKPIVQRVKKQGKKTPGVAGKKKKKVV